jgi:hypothetical protein
MTPRELNAALEGVYGRARAPPRLADFVEMMAAFPDERL